MYQRIQVLRSPTMSILVITFEHVQTNHHVCSPILLKLYEHDEQPKIVIMSVRKIYPSL